MLTVTVAQSSSDDNATDYVLLVFWITSITRWAIWRVALAIMTCAHRAAAFSQYLQWIHQGAPGCLTMSSYTMAANGALGTKRDAYKCLVDTWKAVTSLPAAAVVMYLVEIHLLVWWTFRVEPAVNCAVSPGHVESI